MAQLGVEGMGTAGEAGALHLHVVGDVGEGDLLGEGAAEGLRDPPDGVGGELVAARGVEEVDGAQEADGALLHEVVEGEAAVPVAPGKDDDEAPVGGDEGGAGHVAGAEGLLVERPGGQLGEHARAGVGGEGLGQEGIDDGGEGGRGEREAREEGGEDDGGGGARGDDGGQVAAQARGEVALGQQAGAAAGADRARQVARLGGGEHGGRGDGRGWRDHAGSCVVQGLYTERTRPARVPGGRMGIRGAVPHRATMIPSPPPPTICCGARGPARLPARSRRREEVETGLTGGAREVEAEEGVGQGDGDTRQDALVDLGLAGADEAAQLVGAVAHLIARAPLANGHERGKIVGGDEASQAVGGERMGRRRGLDGEQMPGDEDEECHGGALIPARPADRRPARRLPHAGVPSPRCPPIQ